MIQSRFRNLLYLFFLLAISTVGCKKETFVSESPGGPSVVSFLPGNDAKTTWTNPEISVTFDELMDSSTVTPATFMLMKGDTNVAGNVTYYDKVAVFNPASDLTPNTVYTAKIIAGVKGKSGIPLNGSYVWKFITGDAYHYEMTQRSTSVTDFDRDGTRIRQMGEYIYSYGGWTADPLKTYNDVYRSSGDLSKWTKMPDAPWAGRHTFGMSKLNSTLYILGGDYFNNVFDVWSTTDGLTWKQESDGINSPLGTRILYGTCAHNGKLYVMGGQEGLDEFTSPYDDIWSSTNGRDWTLVAADKTFLGKNISGVCTSFNGKIWVLGGGEYNEFETPSKRWTNEVWSSTDGVAWEQQMNVPWTGRQYANVCVWDQKIWMVGGSNGSNLQDIWYMNTNGAWTRFEDIPSSYIGRHATGLAVYNDKLVITCGNYNNDCWVIEKK